MFLSEANGEQSGNRLKNCAETQFQKGQESRRKRYFARPSQSPECIRSKLPQVKLILQPGQDIGCAVANATARFGWGRDHHHR
jgi:hypothetical protein